MNNENKELRTRTIDLEVRASNDSKVITGYAIVFDELSEDLGGFQERISKRALNGVDLSNVLCLYNHDTSNILARTDSGNLVLKVDDKGLYFEATLPNTTLARDVLENVKAGNIKGCSFGFIAGDVDWQWSENENVPDIRTVKQIKELLEITITPIPAYQDTIVSQRSLQLEQMKLKNQLKLVEYYKENI